MGNIKSIRAREILDSRGNPTVEVEILTDRTSSIASVPSGASTGEHEALELRDKDPARFNGMGVLKAIDNIKNVLSPALIGKNVTEQRAIDELMIGLDGTEYKTKLGANSILPISIATLKCAAQELNLPLFQHIGKIFQNNKFTLPTPMFNLIEGAAHADNNLKVQEYMVVPITNSLFREKLRIGSEIFHLLKNSLKNMGLNSAIGDEGGFAPSLASDEEALKILSQFKGVKISLDFAGIIPPEFDLERIANTYPILSYEDPAEEDDFQAWSQITARLGTQLRIVADDLVITNPKRLEEAISKKAANAVVVKPNQVGTMTETLDFAKLAKENNWSLVVSHRSGETEDTTISDLAVGIGAEFIKSGAPSRTDRTSKYNRLIRIEKLLSR